VTPALFFRTAAIEFPDIPDDREEINTRGEFIERESFRIMQGFGTIRSVLNLPLSQRPKPSIPRKLKCRHWQD
jgi:hypothetical protein